jgi:tetratricopeptide (TPR) repeat protein
VASKRIETSQTRRLFQTALEHHQAGRLSQAEALYRQILQAEPGHPDALHLLGAIARQAGKPLVAADLINRAIIAKPSEPVFYNSLGLVLRDLGRLDEAVANYRKAISIRPDYVETHYNLGNVLQIQDRLDEAIASYRKALAIRPDYAEAHCNLGSALQAQGRLDEAVASYRRAISLRPNHAEAHANLGNTLQELGKLDEAIASYHRALAIKPDYAKARNNLGRALQEQGKFDEAIACYRQAITLRPDFAEVHCNLGGALRGKGTLDEAIASYRQALALKPGFAEALAGWGNALREQGHLDDAVACFRQALTIKPDSVDAYIGLGNALRTQGRLDEATTGLQQAILLKPESAGARSALASVYIDQGQFDAAQLELSTALEYEPHNPNAWAALTQLRKMTPEDSDWLNTALSLVREYGATWSAMDTVKLQFAIGKYYDDTKQYDLAFSAYQLANTLMRRAEGRFDRAQFSRLVDTLIETYAADAVNRQHEGASSSRRPVLVVGMPRSGTSLTEQIIASHPKAYGAGELSFWGTQANQTGARSHDTAFIAKIAAQYEQCLYQHSADAARVVDKMPGNFLWLGLISEAFPHSKIIHTRRNPVDTCVSIYFQNFMRAHSYKTDLDDLAYYYREYDRLMRHWRKVLPADRFLEVSYEALTDNQAEWSRRIIEFIGLEWDERCLDFHKTERKVGTSSNWQVRQKIYHSSKARWRNYEKHLGPLLGLLELE